MDGDLMEYVCKECNKVHSSNQSLVAHVRMAHGKNPMKDPKVVAKVQKTRAEMYRKGELISYFLTNKEELRRKNRKRMIENNPMKDPEIVKKNINAISRTDQNERMSKYMKELWKKPEYRQRVKDGRGEWHHTEETKKLLSELKIGKEPWIKGKKIDLKKYPNYGMKGKSHTEETKRKCRQSALEQKPKFPKFNTSIEKKMKGELKRRNLSFKPQYVIANITRADFALPEQKIVIQCDGDYWHNYPYGTEKDHYQNKVLKELGWMVFRFWEREIQEDVQKCVNKVTDCL